MPFIAQPRLLLIEDDHELALILRSALLANGFDVHCAPGLRDAKRLLADHTPDLILLDLNLEDGNGRQLIEEAQLQAHHTPIIVISGVSHAALKVRALEDGADDFLVKPFHHQELIARIRAVLRRSERNAPSVDEPTTIVFGNFTLDLRSRTLCAFNHAAGGHTADGHAAAEHAAVPLSANLFQLLKLFATHPYQLLTRERIAAAGLGRSHASGNRSIDVLVASLRKVIEEDPSNPQLIKTVWGSGYVFNPSAAPTSPPPAQQSLRLDP